MTPEGGRWAFLIVTLSLGFGGVATVLAMALTGEGAGANDTAAVFAVAVYLPALLILVPLATDRVVDVWPGGGEQEGSA